MESCPQLAKHNLCTGCTACKASCPRDAIEMKPDFFGFQHPHINVRKCVNCGACEKVCPVLSRPSARKPLSVYAAKAKDDGLRFKSASGGVFSLLARQIFKKGGIVYGAAIRQNDLMVYHCAAENEDDLEKLRSSKYVQSDLGNVYREVKAQLAENRQVMFTGTPCQIAGLRAYLKNEYENLLCVDLICHAVPSPLAWKKYLSDRARDLGGCSCAPERFFDYRRISFRCKNSGWKNYLMSLGYAAGETYESPFDRNRFMRGFLSELINRSSCHQCSFRELRSGSDITISDYWRVHEKFPEMDDDRGTSLVLVHTAKGRDVYATISSQLVEKESDFADATRVNPQLLYNVPAQRNRKLFFILVRIPFVRFEWLVEKLTTRSWLSRANSLRFRILSMLRKI